MDPQTLERARAVARLAQLLDSCIPIPGTSWRIGLESLLGLIPGLGDVAGLILGGVLVHQASQAGASPALVRRMARNVALDAVIGLVPVVGDVFDFAFKSNRRNARLLLQHLGEEPPAVDRPHWAIRAGIAVAVLGIGYLIWRGMSS